MKTGFLGLLVLLVCGSCRQEKEEDIFPPSLTLHSPGINGMITAGQPVRALGSAADDKFLAEIHIRIRNLNTGSLLMDIRMYPNGPAMSFDRSISAVSGTNYQVQVVAKDRAQNETDVAVDVSCP